MVRTALADAMDVVVVAEAGATVLADSVAADSAAASLALVSAVALVADDQNKKHKKRPPLQPQ